MAVVLDASAVLALLFDEPGAAKVRERIHGGLLGTTNLAEITAKLTDKGVPAEEAERAVAMLGVEVVPFSEVHARASSAMRPGTRSAGLSLGDRACLALALTRGLPALTAGKRWPDIAEAVGVSVEVIR